MKCAINRNVGYDTPEHGYPAGSGKITCTVISLFIKDFMSKAKDSSSKTKVKDIKKFSKTWLSEAKAKAKTSKWCLRGSSRPRPGLEDNKTDCSVDRAVTHLNVDNDQQTVSLADCSQYILTVPQRIVFLKTSYFINASQYNIKFQCIGQPISRMMDTTCHSG